MQCSAVQCSAVQCSAAPPVAGKVLVNCQMGVSRSSAAVLAYLMLKHGMTAVEALTEVGRRQGAGGRWQGAGGRTTQKKPHLSAKSHF